MPRPRPAPAQRLIASLLVLVLAGSPGAWAQPAPHASPHTSPESAVRLPALGESASDEFNLSAEKRLGEQIMRDIRRDPDYLDDAPLLDYLQSLWQPLVQAARARGDIGSDSQALFPFEAFLVRDRSVNAFALPGGYVGVHLGLIAMTASRDELASVLAHELSHITQRHIARSFSSQQRVGTLGMAALILGVLAAGRSNSPDAAQAVIMGSQAAMLQSQLAFSRDMEREADRNGLALMGQAGFAPAGMAAMFDKLDQANRHNDSGGFPYLRSHPLTVERIGEAQQRIAFLGTPAGTPALDLTHVLMQGRARVLMDPAAQSLRRLQEFDTRDDLAALRPAERLSGYYASALASLRLREFDRAQRALAALRAALPPDAGAAAARPLAQLATQLALERGDLVAAARAIAPLTDDPSRSALLLRAQLALAGSDAGRLRDSGEALQTWVAEHRLDAGAWQLLAQSAQRQGQPLRAVRAEAEVQVALGNVNGAIDRLRAGQQLARRPGGATGGADFIDASVIDARLRELQAQRRQAQAEQRGSGRERRGGPEGDRPE